MTDKNVIIHGGGMVSDGEFEQLMRDMHEEWLERHIGTDSDDDKIAIVTHSAPPVEYNYDHVKVVTV